jgi:uncharacterized protein with HEPN domain
MAPSKTPLNRLNHILEEASEIEAATRGLSFETFRDTWMIRRSVEHGLLIIAEAIKTLPPELKSVRQDIPWGKIESLGNYLRHEYRDIDPAILWRIVRRQLVELVAAVHDIIASMEKVVEVQSVLPISHFLSAPRQLCQSCPAD